MLHHDGKWQREGKRESEINTVDGQMAPLGEYGTAKEKRETRQWGSTFLFDICPASLLSELARQDVW